jgi:hypothetical protein
MLAGAAQVGKASLAGWREILLPALERNRNIVRIWPFDGPLHELVRPGTVTLAETYPAECYAHFGISNSDKTSTNWRREAARAISDHASARDVVFSERLRGVMASGFGPNLDGEDPFDAMAGAVLLALVALGHDTTFEPASSDESTWEGWILGRPAP